MASTADGTSNEESEKGSLEPIAAVGDPPRKNHDGDGRDDPPPEWQDEIGDEAEDREDRPEDFSLHQEILACVSSPRTVTEVQFRGNFADGTMSIFG